jgi:prohibitin 1
MVERLLDRMGKLGGGLLLSGIFLSKFVFVVEPGERAIIQNNLRGLQHYVYGEGMHFRIPVRDNIKRFEVRTRPTLINCDTGTKDMQSVNIVMRILFRPVEQELPTILLTLGEDYDQRLIPQIAQEVVKTTCA